MTQKFSAQRKRAFLTYLAQSGNQTLSAERARVSRSWVQLHRSTDAAFDAACREAIEEARERLSKPPPLRGHSIDPDGSMEPLSPLRPAHDPHESRSPAKGRGAGWRYHDGAELVVQGTGGAGGGKRVQVRRARLKQWTPRVEQRFLTALAATCNVKAACAEVGLWPPSAYNHRHRWPKFARAWDEAVEAGYVRLEAALVATGCNSLGDPGVEPEVEPDLIIRDMTAADAIQLLRLHKQQAIGQGRGLPGRPPRVASMEEVIREMKRAARRTKAWLARQGANGAVTE